MTRAQLEEAFTEAFRRYGDDAGTLLQALLAAADQYGGALTEEHARPHPWPPAKPRATTNRKDTPTCP